MDETETKSVERDLDDNDVIGGLGGAFLRTDDVIKPREFVVTDIKIANMKNREGKERDEYILYLDGGLKTVMNKTNRLALQDAFNGGQPMTRKQWIGKRIRVSRTRTNYNGGTPGKKFDAVLDREPGSDDVAF